MIKKILIGIGIIIGLGIIGVVVYIIALMSAFGLFDKDYSVTELKENYYSHQQEIIELKKYYNSIVPLDKFVEIEFTNNKTLNRFGIQEINYKKDRPGKSLFLDWDIKIHSHKMDSLLNTLGWTQKNLTELKEKLDKADCIQIESGEPTKIGFKRSGMGMYSFILFDKPIPDSLRNQYNDSCTYILADEKLVLEYGGGAIGPQCFYNLN